MRFAYADPPYLGQAKRHYAKEAEADGRVASEVDHVELIERLSRDYPDGWALSLSSPTLKTILPMCPDDVRVMAWVKPFAAFKRNVRVAYAWEPIIVKPAVRLDGAIPTRDFIEDLDPFDLDLAVRESITMKRGLTGAKPERMCHWLFGAMGMRPGLDQLDDLFHGSGAVKRAWESWTVQEEIAA